MGVGPIHSLMFTKFGILRGGQTFLITNTGLKYD